MAALHTDSHGNETDCCLCDMSDPGELVVEFIRGMTIDYIGMHICEDCRQHIRDSFRERTGHSVGDIDAGVLFSSTPQDRRSR